MAACTLAQKRKLSSLGAIEQTHENHYSPQTQRSKSTGNRSNFFNESDRNEHQDDAVDHSTPAKRRKMTGHSSKHFSPRKHHSKTLPPAPRSSSGSPDHTSEVISLRRTIQQPPSRPLSRRIRRAGHPIPHYCIDAVRAWCGVGLHTAVKHSDGADPIRSPAKRKDSPRVRSLPQIEESTIRSTDANVGSKASESTGSRRVREVAMVLIPAPSDSTSRTNDYTVPPIKAQRFGIIQESLWNKPFWLLVAVVLLNQTGGKKAIPAVGELARRYQKPENLAVAEQTDVCEIIHHLGLQNQRSSTLIKMAQAWVTTPPAKGNRYGTPRYPHPDDRSYGRGKPVDGDAADCAGALEIGHIPGCGPYAWDSWRIFCRDALRGVARDYDGAGAGAPDFEPEWKRVEPLDKELRACLRWMWLREGWVWDDRTYERRRATAEDMLRVSETFTDQRELAMAAQAAVALELSAGGEALLGKDDGVVSIRDSVMLQSDESVSMDKQQDSHLSEPPVESSGASASLLNDEDMIPADVPCSKDEGWKCSICARAFASRRGLNAHTRIKHGPNANMPNGDSA